MRKWLRDFYREDKLAFGFAISMLMGMGVVYFALFLAWYNQ